MKIETVKDIKELIEGFPDDTKVEAYEVPDRVMQISGIGFSDGAGIETVTFYVRGIKK